MQDSKKKLTIQKATGLRFRLWAWLDSESTPAKAKKFREKFIAQFGEQLLTRLMQATQEDRFKPSAEAVEFICRFFSKTVSEFEVSNKKFMLKQWLNTLCSVEEAKEFRDAFDEIFTRHTRYCIQDAQLGDKYWPSAGIVAFICQFFGRQFEDFVHPDALRLGSDKDKKMYHALTSCPSVARMQERQQQEREIL